MKSGFIGTLIGLALAALIALWLSHDVAPKAERRVRTPPIVTKLDFKRYRLGEAEHMLIIDIPDRYVPRRCAVYVNESTKTTHLNCNFDDAGAPFPQANEEE